MEAESGHFSDWQRHEKKVVVKLTLVRHGETVANRDRIVQGQTPGELTDFGREQARRLGKRLTSQRWDAFYCSDLARTQQTAQELLQGAGADVGAIMADSTLEGLHNHLQTSEQAAEAVIGSSPKSGKANFAKMTSMKLLRERSAGELEGGPSGCVEAAAKAAGVTSRSFRPARGESWEDVQARADRFLRWLVNTHMQPVERQPSKLPESGPPPESLPRDGARASFAGGTANVATSVLDGAQTKRTPVATSTDMGGTLETGLPKRMLRSRSFHREPSDKGKEVEVGPRRGVPRSGSFTGDPRSVSQVLGIPRSASFAEDLVPRVTGVKRASSFDALAPKVMKRVDSLGLSRLFNDELRVGAQDGAAKTGVTGRVRSSGLESDCSGDEGLVGGGTRGGEMDGVDMEGRGEGEGSAVKGLASEPNLRDEEMQVDREELENVIGRDARGGKEGLKSGPHNSVGLDLGPSDKGMHVHQLAGGSRKEKQSADGLEERSRGGAQKARLEDGKPSADGGVGGRGDAVCTDAGRKVGPSSGGSPKLLARCEDGDVQRPFGKSDGCVESGSTGMKGQLSGDGESAQERPKARRKGGRPPVIRILAVTHGGFIKEFVNVSMAYAEGPNLSRTRSQTQQSLGWRMQPNLRQALATQAAVQRSGGVNGTGGALSPWGPIQIQRTLGHNDFVSIRAVDENGRCENVAANGQGLSQSSDLARKLTLDTESEIATPKRLIFSRDDSPGSSNPRSQQAKSGTALAGSSSPNASPSQSSSLDFDGISDVQLGTSSTSCAVYPGRPRNTSVYEFEIKRLEGREGTPRFTVKMIRENDVYHLNGLVAIKTFQSTKTSSHGREKVLWQSPVAKLIE